MTIPSFPPEFPPEPFRPDPFRPGPFRPEPVPSRPRDPAAYQADRLLERRIVLASGYLDGERAADLSARLLLLDSMGNEPVTLHLRTHDGDLDAAFAVADTIGVLGCQVRAIVAGQVGGPALAVLAAARRREMTPHATLRLAEPRARFEGDASDVAAREEEHRRLVDALYIRLAEVTGREVDEIRAEAREGRVLPAEEAITYGLVHEVVHGTRPGG